MDQNERRLVKIEYDMKARKGQEDVYHVLTDDEKRLSLAWHMWEQAGRSLADFLGTEGNRRQVISYMNSLFAEWLEPVELSEELWSLLEGQAWLSYSWCKGMSFILQDSDPGTAIIYKERARHLKDTDEPDLGRSGWWWTGKYSVEDTAEVNARDILKKLGYGTFGPKDQDAKLHPEIATLEAHYRSRLIHWIELFGEDIVKEFIDLERVYRFNYFRRIQEGLKNDRRN